MAEDRWQRALGRRRSAALALSGSSRTHLQALSSTGGEGNFFGVRLTRSDFVDRKATGNWHKPYCLRWASMLVSSPTMLNDPAEIKAEIIRLAKEFSRLTHG